MIVGRVAANDTVRVFIVMKLFSLYRGGGGQGVVDPTTEVRGDAFAGVTASAA